MPIKNLHYIVYDYETSGLLGSPDSTPCQPIEIAAQVYNGRSLEPIPGAVFDSLCRPTKDVKIDAKVFEITKITPQEIEKATPIEIVFPKFIEFVAKYNTEGSKWGAPIACGHNIVNFDNIITKNMLGKFGKKKEATVMFHEMHHVDSMDIMYQWFNDNRDLQAYNMTAICNFFGIDTSGAHRARVDVKNSGDIIMRFLKFNRELSKMYVEKFRNSFGNNTIKPLEIRGREIV